MEQISPRQAYNDWVEDQIEEYKAGLTRDEILTVAEDAVHDLFDSEDQQVPLTEILLRDAVDLLIFRRLRLPSYGQWLRLCRSDTAECPEEGTTGGSEEERQVS
jgi:hypothetical protein